MDTATRCASLHRSPSLLLVLLAASPSCGEFANGDDTSTGATFTESGTESSATTYDPPHPSSDTTDGESSATFTESGSSEGSNTGTSSASSESTGCGAAHDTGASGADDGVMTSIGEDTSTNDTTVGAEETGGESSGGA